MVLSKATRIALIVAGAAVVVAVLGFAWASGATLDASDLIGQLAAVIGAIAAGLGIAGGRGRGAGAALVLFGLALGATGCVGAECQVERTVVSSLGAGLAVAQQQIPDDATEATQAINIAKGVAILGRAAVDGCELARDSEGWQSWVALALEAAGEVAAHFGGAADAELPAAPPPELRRAMDLLRGEAH